MSTQSKNLKRKADQMEKSISSNGKEEKKIEFVNKKPKRKQEREAKEAKETKEAKKASQKSKNKKNKKGKKIEFSDAEKKEYYKQKETIASKAREVDSEQLTELLKQVVECKVITPRKHLRFPVTWPLRGAKVAADWGKFRAQHKIRAHLYPYPTDDATIAMVLYELLPMGGKYTLTDIIIDYITDATDFTAAPDRVIVHQLMAPKKAKPMVKDEDVMEDDDQQLEQDKAAPVETKEEKEDPEELQWRQDTKKALRKFLKDRMYSGGNHSKLMTYASNHGRYGMSLTIKQAQALLKATTIAEPLKEDSRIGSTSISTFKGLRNGWNDHEYAAFGQTEVFSAQRFPQLMDAYFMELITVWNLLNAPAKKERRTRMVAMMDELQEQIDEWRKFVETKFDAVIVIRKDIAKSKWNRVRANPFNTEEEKKLLGDKKKICYIQLLDESMYEERNEKGDISPLLNRQRFFSYFMTIIIRIIDYSVNKNRNADILARKKKLNAAKIDVMCKAANSITALLTSIFVAKNNDYAFYSTESTIKAVQGYVHDFDWNKRKKDASFIDNTTEVFSRVSAIMKVLREADLSI